MKCEATPPPAEGTNYHCLLSLAPKKEKKIKQKQQTKQTNNTTKSKYAREVYINLKYKREKKAK